jgi:hypothetical protein
MRPAGHRMKMLILEISDIYPRLGAPKHSADNMKGGETGILLFGEEGFLRGKWFLYSKP